MTFWSFYKKSRDFGWRSQRIEDSHHYIFDLISNDSLFVSISPMKKKSGNSSSFTLYLFIFLICIVSIVIYLNQTVLTFPQPPNIRKEPPPIISTKDNAKAISNKKKIAYAITVTKDGHFLDGALVLGHSALKVHDASKGYNSEYDAELVAFVTSTVQYARPVLEKYGWKVLERPLPVELSEIRNEKYVTNMRSSGCCGADEFLKLWAYTLIDYHRVVHLDMDSIVYQNMDELYDIDKEMLYTGDWNMKGSSPVPPVQGGFIVIRPSMTTFEEYKEVIREGNYSPGKGWGGSGIGAFWGGQTIQGILPYYYHSLHPGEALEVNRLVTNV